jgi:site-specific DNA-methyltransferase (adenine-specific)
MRTEVIGNCRLILGDCREVLPTLSGIDCLVTDPPYKVTSGGFGDLEGGFGGWIKDAYDNKGKIVQCDLEWSDWLNLTPAALRDNAHVYIFSNGRNLSIARSAAEGAGLDFHTLLVWDKKTALPNRWYQQVCEFVLFMRKGKAFMIKDPSSKSLQSIFQRDESCHPTEKPVELCSLYIGNSTERGETVLDPFMGSGTSLVACAKLGRKGIGIELEPKYFDIACRRVEAAYKQGDLFIEPPRKAEQGSMDV